MNYGVTLCLVLMATYAFASVSLSMLVAGIWSLWLEGKPLSSRVLLALQMFPSAGAWFLALCVVLPAFLTREPSRTAEPVGPMLMLMAAYALSTIGAGFLRGWLAWSAAAALVRNRGAANRRFAMAGHDVDIIDVPGTVVAIIGVWRPRIVATPAVLTVCDEEEIGTVIRHEAAHIVAHDNLKLLLMTVCPDMLRWIPAGESLTGRWRAQVEFEADAMATGSDRRKRVALAAALIKVARLSGAKRQGSKLMMSVTTDDVEGRVRRLLEPLPAEPRTLSMKLTAVAALLFAVAAVPLYGSVQEMIEILVALGH